MPPPRAPPGPAAGAAGRGQSDRRARSASRWPRAHPRPPPPPWCSLAPGCRRGRRPQSPPASLRWPADHAAGRRSALETPHHSAADRPPPRSADPASPIPPPAVAPHRRAGPGPPARESTHRPVGARQPPAIGCESGCGRAAVRLFDSHPDRHVAIGPGCGGSVSPSS